MKNKAILFSILMASTVAGFVCTFAAGLMLASLNSSVDAVSGWQYVSKVLLPLLGSLVGVCGRIYIRRQLRVGCVSPAVEKQAQQPAVTAPAGETAVDRMLAAVGLEVNAHAANGNTAHVRTLMDAADIIKKTAGELVS